MKSKNKNIFSYIKKYKIPFLLFGICVLITSSTILAIGKGLVFFIDQGIALEDSSILLKSLSLLTIMVTILAFATFGRFFIITYWGEKIICDIRQDLFKHLLTLSADFFEKNKIGELISRISNDLAILQSTLSSSLSIFFRNILIFIGCLSILFATNLKLTILVFAIIPVIIFPIIFLAKKLRKYSKTAQDKMANMSSIMEENISNIKLVQSYGGEKQINSNYKNSLEEILLAVKNRVLIRSILTTTIMVIVFSGIAVILYQGGLSVFNGDITAGEFSAFLFYTILLAGSFGAIAEIAGNIQKARGATKNLFDLFKEKSSIKDGKIEIQKFNNLEFKNTSFTYPSRKENSLNNINFSIKKGEKIAFVGPSGAGKSTIFELLQRFYDSSKGSISINNKKITSYKLEHLRKLFAIVNQDSAIFSTSIEKNLLFANQQANKQEITNALSKASAIEFIEKLPKKQKTYLGEKGIRLSTGEKQRISIARAILKDSPIILLDEPTSNLDSINEKLLQNMLKEFQKDKTILIIAHRLSTVKEADRIIVLDQGKIIESGTHKELIKNNSLYKNLVDLQFQE